MKESFSKGLSTSVMKKSFSNKLKSTFIILWFHFSMGVMIVLNMTYLMSYFSTTYVVISSKYIFLCIGLVLSGIFFGDVCERAFHSSSKYISLNNLFLSSVVFVTLPLFSIYIPYVWVYIVSHFFIGIGYSLYCVITVMMVMRLWRGSRLYGFFMQLQYVFYSLGCVMSPLIVSFVMSKTGYGVTENMVIVHNIFISMLSLSFLILVFPVDTVRYGVCRDYKCGVRKIEVSESKKEAFRVYRVIFVVLSNLVLFCYVAGGIMYGSVIGVFVMDEKLNYKHFTEYDGNALIALYYLSLAWGRILNSLKMSFMSAITVLLIDHVLLLATIIVLLNYYKNYYILIICTVIMGACQASFYATTYMIPDRFRFKLTGVELSVITLGCSEAWILPYFTIYLMDMMESVYFLYLFAVICCLASIIFCLEYIFGLIYMMKRRKLKEKEMLLPKRLSETSEKMKVLLSRV